MCSYYDFGHQEIKIADVEDIGVKVGYIEM